jgi:hypothetical protein
LFTRNTSFRSDGTNLRRPTDCVVTTDYVVRQIVFVRHKYLSDDIKSVGRHKYLLDDTNICLTTQISVWRHKYLSDDTNICLTTQSVWRHNLSDDTNICLTTQSVWWHNLSDDTMSDNTICLTTLSVGWHYLSVDTIRRTTLPVRRHSLSDDTNVLRPKSGVSCNKPIGMLLISPLVTTFVPYSRAVLPKSRVYSPLWVLLKGASVRIKVARFFSVQHTY